MPSLKRAFSKNRILRIIDANLNRLKEGLRVCEDTTRFVLNDAVCSRALRGIRHSVDRIVAASKVDYDALFECRNVKADVGLDFSSPEKKSGWQSVFLANMQRAKESARVLEEFFKLFDNNTGEKFKGLRFKVYGVEKEVIKKFKALSYR